MHVFDSGLAKSTLKALFLERGSKPAAYRWVAKHFRSLPPKMAFSFRHGLKAVCRGSAVKVSRLVQVLPVLLKGSSVDTFIPLTFVLMYFCRVLRYRAVWGPTETEAWKYTVHALVWVLVNLWHHDPRDRSHHMALHLRVVEPLPPQLLQEDHLETFHRYGARTVRNACHNVCNPATAPSAKYAATVTVQKVAKHISAHCNRAKT